MDVIKRYYDKSVNTQSRVCNDYVMKKNVDQKGEEHISWEKYDYAKHQKELGPVENWGLENLMKAGINPDMPIHTGYNTRIEGVSDIESMSTMAESLTTETENTETTE